MAKTTRIALLCSGAALLCHAAPAWAQNAAPQPAPPQATPTGTGSTSTTGPATLQEVVVTANRREQSVIKVPEQITALTGENLANRDLRSIDEFVGFVPGLNVQTANPGANLLVVRGVTTGSQSSNAVGAYLDDVPLNASNGFAAGQVQLSINAFDLDRVEVLSGPQGTLYGASSLGGTIRYITAKPQLYRYSAEVDGEVSSTAHGGTNDGERGMINIPIVEGRLAFRADLIHQYDSGFEDDPGLGLHDQGAGRVNGVRASLLGQITDKLDVQFTVFSQDDDDTGLNAADRNPTGGRVPGEGYYQQTFALPQDVNQSAKIVYGTINYNLGFAKLTSITSYQWDHYDSVLDISPVYSAFFGADPYKNDLVVGLHKFNQEERLVSNGNRFFDWVLGGYYSNERGNDFTDIINEGDPTGGIVVVPGLPSFPIFAATIPTLYREIAGYADGTFHFTPRLDLLLGIRYSNNHQTFSETLSGLFGNPTSPFTSRSISATSNENVPTYLINPNYKITNDVSVYARIANGFRPGGPTLLLPGSSGKSSFGADTLWTYEIGTKASLFEHRFQATLSAYDSEWHDIQLSTIISGLSQLTNAGDARVDGGEATFAWRATRALTLNGSATYTDARLTTTAPALGIAYTGARLPISPRFAFALGADYVVQLANGQPATFSLTDQYQGERYSGFVGSDVNLPYRLAPYNLVNGDISVGLTSNLEVGVYAKNIFDSRGEVYGNRTNDLGDPTAPAEVTLTRPRTVGFQFRLKL